MDDGGDGEYSAEFGGDEGGVVELKEEGIFEAERGVDDSRQWWLVIKKKKRKRGEGLSEGKSVDGGSGGVLGSTKR